jgi:prepilin-type processing-associated H-X9-DG protein/prepilin-type N-terminal cleavage/methylation domain-containing protein
MQKSANHFVRSAFTLVEALVVVAIIGLLAALLLPALNRSRIRARQIGCLSNMRQLGVGISLFTTDSNGVLPRSDDADASDPIPCWFYAVDPYLLNRAVSPSPSAVQKLALFKQDPIWTTFDSNSRANWRTIKMNRKLVGQKGVWNPGTDLVNNAIPSHRVKVTINDMANTVLLFDGRTEDSNSSGDKSRFDGWEVYVDPRHFGGANVLFVDGHAEWRKEKQQATGAATGWENDQTTLNWWGTQ